VDLCIFLLFVDPYLLDGENTEEMARIGNNIASSLNRHKY